ncbi:MAG: radical SAM protein [Verrucomicrobia bacterium]|nr:radical SAM protein [Verrucomicrobiota bacterium]
MRRSNRALQRSRVSPDQLAELILRHRPACVTDINLQAGEDPVAVREVALPLIKLIRRHTQLGVSVCLGTLEPSLYQELQDAGASIYIIKFECSNPTRYIELRAPGTLEERTAHIRWLADRGWFVSSGFIAGLPTETPSDVLAHLQYAATLPLHGCSVSPFIPGELTPLAAANQADPDLTLNCMAALRLLKPDWVIPAVSALNSVDEEGYRKGLRAGANLVTINMTPDQMRQDYVIYKRGRIIMTEELVLSAVNAERLTPSSVSLAEYYRRSTASPIVAPMASCHAG